MQEKDPLLTLIGEEIRKKWRELVNKHGAAGMTVMENPSLRNAGAMPYYLIENIGPLIRKATKTEQEAKTAVNLVLEHMPVSSFQGEVPDMEFADFGSPVTIIVFDVQPAVELAANTLELQRRCQSQT